MTTALPAPRIDPWVRRGEWSPWRPCGGAIKGGGGARCADPGWGIGGRCEVHGGTNAGSGRPLVLFAGLACDDATSHAAEQSVPPFGPARVYVAPERLWDAVAVNGDWSERASPGAERRTGRKRAVRQPIALEPGRGGWPQIISGRIARALCRQRGTVSRVLVTAEFLDGWWLRELLTRNVPPDDVPGILARFTSRDPSQSCDLPPDAVAELVALARAEHTYYTELGIYSWT